MTFRGSKRSFQPMKKKLLIIGFQPYDEKMYPHLYDFLQAMERAFQVLYFDKDLKGYDAILIHKAVEDIWKRPDTLKRILSFFKQLLLFCIRILRRQRAFKKLLQEHPDIIIAIDHSAVNLAARYADASTKLIFWSHDLVHIDGEWYQYPLMRRIIARNKKVMRRYQGIIIQDHYRGILLEALLGTPRLPKFYFPVSLADDDNAQKIAQQKLQQPPRDHLRLMQITFDERRGSVDILEAYQHLGDHVTLCFQGSASTRTEETLARYSRKAEYSPIRPAFADMRQQIVTADIGVIHYPPHDLNHLFVSSASGQLAEFLRLGIPIIVLQNYELGQFIERTHTGVFLEQAGNLARAIDAIRDQYAFYSHHARQLYETRYNIAHYSRAFVQWIETLSEKSSECAATAEEQHEHLASE